MRGGGLGPVYERTNREEEVELPISTQVKEIPKLRHKFQKS